MEARGVAECKTSIGNKQQAIGNSNAASALNSKVHVRNP